MINLLKATEGLRYKPVLVFIAGTGMGRGEALGIAWRNVNLEKARCSSGPPWAASATSCLTEPKAERSRRTLPLSPTMVAL